MPAPPTSDVDIVALVARGRDLYDEFSQRYQEQRPDPPLPTFGPTTSRTRSLVALYSLMRANVGLPDPPRMAGSVPKDVATWKKILTYVLRLWAFQAKEMPTNQSQQLPCTLTEDQMEAPGKLVRAEGGGAVKTALMDPISPVTVRQLELSMQLLDLLNAPSQAPSEAEAEPDAVNAELSRILSLKSVVLTASSSAKQRLAQLSDILAHPRDGDDAEKLKQKYMDEGRTVAGLLRSLGKMQLSKEDATAREPGRQRRQPPGRSKCPG
ncbi:hypothetical protein C8A03DRAFT_29279 [Achaetomium macrosporum]|uniref:Uncharacterized protein n=1 Tax=Achaetomium macrosporum TaxID=79813 RepID=A0AAN7CI75_9PEZI|nr:hypothetical protein C8A03DRAFT_29279 [Achaetomium macrosporum]